MVMINWIGLAASIAGVFLLIFCDCLLAWRKQRRLTVMQMQIDNLSTAIRSLEAARIGLLARPVNLPRSRKSPNPLVDKKSTESVLSVVAPKISPDYYDSCL